MSHFSHEVSYGADAYLSRQMRVVGLSVLLGASLLSWLYISILLVSSGPLGLLAVGVLLMAVLVVAYRFFVSLSVPPKTRRRRAQLRAIFKRVDAYRARGETRPTEALPLTVEVGYFITGWKDALTVVVTHDNPMYKPWKFLVKRDAIYSVDATPHPLDVIWQLLSAMEAAPGFTDKKARHLLGAFQPIDVPEVTPQLSAAIALQGD